MWECKYHVAFIPKFRRRALFGVLREAIGSVFRELAREKESTIMVEHVMPDHVHMLISIPPKSSVSSAVGFLKGKSAIWIARHTGRRQNFTGKAFWTRCFYISTVGADKETIRVYVHRQGEVDRREDQLELLFFETERIGRFWTAVAVKRLEQQPL